MTTLTTPGKQYTGTSDGRIGVKRITTYTKCTKFIDFTNLDYETLDQDLSFEYRTVEVNKDISFRSKKRPDVVYVYSWIKKCEAEIEKLTHQKLEHSKDEVKPLKECKRRKTARKIQAFWEANMTNQSRIAKLLRVGKAFVK